MGGGLTFYQEPLYAYLMAVTYKIFGGDHRWVAFSGSSVLGVLTNVLIYLLARRMFGDLVRDGSWPPWPFSALP